MARTLDGQAAIIMGASSGIDHGVARTFANAGAAVVANDQSSPEPARRPLEKVDASGGRARATGTDVADGHFPLYAGFAING